MDKSRTDQRRMVGAVGQSGSWVWPLLLIALMAGCTKHEVTAPVVVSKPQTVQQPHAVERRMMERQQDSEIDLLMGEVRQGDLDLPSAQQQLLQMIEHAPSVVSDEARFRLVELQLEFDDPYARSHAEALLLGWSNHALIPYLHHWLSRWLLRHNDRDGALQHLAAVVDAVGITAELRHKALQQGLLLLAAEPDDSVAGLWLLRRMASLQDDDLLAAAQLAASRSSLQRMAALRQQGMINQPLFAPYYQAVARIALMRGDRDALATIADWAASDIAGTAEANMVRRWQSGRSRKVRVGLLLPLTGRYARFGQQALHGVRMAVDSLRYGKQITLVVADSQGDDEATVAGYRHLLAQGCVVVVGPLLANGARALSAHLRPDVPVVALTNQQQVADLAPALFVHSVGPQAQADFLAEMLMKELYQRTSDSEAQQPLPQVAVIAGSDRASQASATLFQQRLERDGVASVHRLTIDNTVDERQQLIALRRDSDDALLLDELDEDLSLFIAERDLQPMMPPGLVAIYLPMRGKQVAQLAGQLAYVGLNQVMLLGDSRWQDGHLLDDHGRYLATARIGVVPSSVSSTRHAAAVSYSAAEAYRQLWGDHAQSLLGDVAFDSLLVVATLTSSWGLQGIPLLRALHDPSGFPLATGRVVFDRHGVGHKRLTLLALRDGALVVEE